MKLPYKTLSLLGLMTLSSNAWSQPIEPSSNFQAADKVKINNGLTSRRFNLPREYFFEFNDNNHYIRQMVYPNGGMYYDYMRSYFDATHLYQVCTEIGTIIPFGITNDNTAISYIQFRSQQERGYIAAWNSDTNTCTYMDIGAYFTLKDFNDKSVVVYESDGILLRYDPATADNEIVPTAALGVTHAKINDEGYIAYSLDANRSYFIKPNSTASILIPQLDVVQDINDNNMVVGSTATACYIYDLDGRELHQIDDEPCIDLKAQINDSNIAVIDRPNNAATAYRLSTDQQFSVATLSGYGGTMGPLSRLNNNNRILFENYPEAASSSVRLQMSFPPPAYEIQTLDNSDRGFQTSSTMVPIKYMYQQVYIPLSPDSWQSSQQKQEYFGSDYIKIASGTGSQTVSWTMKVNIGHLYHVLVRYPVGVNNNTEARYMVRTGSETREVIVNQQLNGGTWVSLGSFNLADNDSLTVELSNQGDGETVADAIRIKPM